MRNPAKIIYAALVLVLMACGGFFTSRRANADSGEITSKMVADATSTTVAVEEKRSTNDEMMAATVAIEDTAGVQPALATHRNFLWICPLPLSV